MTDTKILIVVSDAEAGDAYVHALEEIGVSCDVAHSFQQMSEMATSNAYNGMLVDILALVRSSKEDKVIAYECINLFPVLRVKWDARYKRMKLSPLEQGYCPDTETALRYFLENRCKAFPARSLRNHTRKQINLSLLYCVEETFSEEHAHRSFTINLSLRGAFLHTMLPLREGQRVWLRFLEFADRSPLAATVRWSRPWGVTRCIPGAGVQFEGLTEEQEQEIGKILYHP
ncbi:MAG TPA: PilZ domain-containing protein [Geobacter sp.]|nr:PilZ domain-containing protein [Geobacter sp.]